MTAFRIVSAGYDHDLMHTRSMVLRQAGFVVDEAYSPLGVLGLVKSDSIDAVLLCHTIPKDEQRWLIVSIRKARLLLPIISIKASVYDSAQDGCFIATNEPVDLLGVLRRAIQPPAFSPGNA